MGNIEKIDMVYRFMDVKGIGCVQTNKFILSIYKYDNIIDIEKEIELILNKNQLSEFEKKISIIDNLESKYETKFLTLVDDLYPDELKKFLKGSTPPILSYTGNIDLLKKQKVGFSGSRKVSAKGIDITTDCVVQLSQKDISIVSGYAKGVDLEAHKNALKNGGTTIIILPEGINSFSVRRDLKDIWDWDKVLVISEFKPTDIWMTSRAMQRNNTIIALSDIMAIVEAGETGGSYDAGEKTIQFGKYLFVPQYSEVPESALGNNLLIRKGAFPIKKSKETLKANLSKMFELLNMPKKYQLF